MSDAELKAARKEGAKQDVADNAAETHRFLTDGNLPGEPPKAQYPGSDESQPYAHLLDLGEKAFVERVKANPKKDGQAMTDTMVHGLLALERNGKNRTPYVKVMMDRLPDVDADNLPGGGPDYTNDVSNISDL